MYHVIQNVYSTHVNWFKIVLIFNAYKNNYQ